MASVAETSTDKSKSFRESKIYKRARATILATLFLGGSVYVINHDQISSVNAQNNYIEAVDHKNELDVAVNLARAGFTNLVLVDTINDEQFATLSSNPADPKACKVDFAVAGSGETTHLVLNQKDATGHVFDRINLTSGADSLPVLADICG